jgi:cell division septation protein DedD
MSRVFEALTAAVCEKNDPGRRELPGYAAEGDLIGRFHPALRNERASTEGASPLDSLMTKETHQAKTSDCHATAVHEDQWNSESRPDFHHFRGASVVTLVAVVALVMGYLEMPADYANQKQVNSTNTSFNRQQSVPATETSEAVETRPAKRELSIPASTEGSRVPAKLDSTARPLLIRPPNKMWSVQVSAITSKETADRLMQDLKSEGYNVYIVRAEIRGQTYHRVRIGRFSAREEAEPVRQSLSRHEAYQDAYLAAD